MAFDFTKLEGYRDDMTADEKLALLDNYEPPVPDPKPENVVSKAQFDKVASELSSVKKELRARMSKEEQDASDRAAAENDMKNELETLRKERKHDKYVKHYLTIGYDEALAEEAATAKIEDDDDALFEAEKKYKSTLEKNVRAQIMKDVPLPPNGDDPNNDAQKKKEEENTLRKYLGLPPLK